MLANLLGSVNKERVLVYLAARGKGYSREIARFFGATLSPVQNALDKLESAGVLVSRAIGNAREYELNPRYPARAELVSLLNRALALYPAALRDELLLSRSRPRRRGKPP
jgi:DNA-binding MarR family transcriptional regulator